MLKRRRRRKEGGKVPYILLEVEEKNLGLCENI